jgi:cell division septation protein DedD
MTAFDVSLSDLASLRSVDPLHADRTVIAAGAPVPATTFALSVGTYLNEARAREEQSKLSAGTNFTASVSTVQEDNVSMYRVMMGEFPTRGAAERAASDLISRGLVDEARVITRRVR